MTDLIAHDVAGAGSPVLLLHSGAADRRQWEAQWSSLADRHLVVRCDLRGFGETPLPESTWSDSDDLVSLLDHLGLERVAVVGSSYGGRIALELASVAPQRISQLVLLCAAYPGVPTTSDVEQFGTEEDALLEAGDLEAAVELNVRTWLGPEASAQVRADLAGWQRHTFELQQGAPDDLGPASPDVDPVRIDVPTTLVTGGHDLDFFRAIGHHLRAELPSAELVELAWAGHLPNLERPVEITELLLAILGRDQ